MQTRKFALFETNVPAAHTVAAGDRLFVNINCHTTLPPWCLKLSLKRTMRLRLGHGGGLIAASPLARALCWPAGSDTAGGAAATAPAAPAPALELRATVQRFIAVRPFVRAFEGAYFIVVPQRCCSFASAGADVGYELKVQLNFGFGRVMTHTVPLTVRHWLGRAARCAAGFAFMIGLMLLTGSCL